MLQRMGDSMVIERVWLRMHWNTLLHCYRSNATWPRLQGGQHWLQAKGPICELACIPTCYLADGSTVELGTVIGLQRLWGGLDMSTSCKSIPLRILQLTVLTLQKGSQLLSSGCNKTSQNRRCSSSNINECVNWMLTKVIW